MDALRIFITTKWKAWAAALAVVLASVLARNLHAWIPALDPAYDSDIQMLVLYAVLGAGGWLIAYISPANQPSTAVLVSQAEGDPKTRAVVRAAAAQMGGARVALLCLALGAAGFGLAACPSGTGSSPTYTVQTQEQTDHAVAASPADLLAVAESSYKIAVRGLRVLRDAGVIERGGALEASITKHVDAADDALARASTAVLAKNATEWERWYGTAMGAIGFLQFELSQRS